MKDHNVQVLHAGKSYDHSYFVPYIYFFLNEENEIKILLLHCKEMK